MATPVDNEWGTSGGRQTPSPHVRVVLRATDGADLQPVWRRHLTSCVGRP